MLNGANDASVINMNKPVVANTTANATTLTQKKSGSKWAYGALKTYADTDEILDMKGEVDMEGLYNQNLLELYMRPSN